MSERASEATKARIETLIAAGWGASAIVEDVGCSRAMVERVQEVFARYRHVEANAFNDEGRHLDGVLADRPEGFPARHLPATYRVRA